MPPLSASHAGWSYEKRPSTPRGSPTSASSTDQVANGGGPSSNSKTPSKAPTHAAPTGDTRRRSGGGGHDASGVGGSDGAQPDVGGEDPAAPTVRQPPPSGGRRQDQGSVAARIRDRRVLRVPLRPGSDVEGPPAVACGCAADGSVAAGRWIERSGRSRNAAQSRGRDDLGSASSKTSSLDSAIGCALPRRPTRRVSGARCCQPRTRLRWRTAQDPGVSTTHRSSRPVWDRSQAGCAVDPRGT